LLVVNTVNFLVRVYCYWLLMSDTWKPCLQGNQEPLVAKTRMEHTQAWAVSR